MMNLSIYYSIIRLYIKFFYLSIPFYEKINFKIMSVIKKSLKLFLNSKLIKKFSYDELKVALISGFDISQLKYVKKE